VTVLRDLDQVVQGIDNLVLGHGGLQQGVLTGRYFSYRQEPEPT
jgi:hypothetical protein